MSKPKLQARLAALGFSEKIKILENCATGKKQLLQVAFAAEWQLPTMGR